MTTRATPRVRRPERLAYTPDPDAQRLAAQNPIAFLIGFVLDQQIRIQHAFHSPLHLQERLGHLDPRRIAEMPLDELVEVFCDKPVLHRYPGSMAKRVQQCMRFVVERYDGDADRIWSESTDLADLRTRLHELPGFGEAKARTVAAVLSRQFGLAYEGWEQGLPPYGSLAYVDSLEDLEEYQRRKGEYKKAQKASG